MTNETKTWAELSQNERRNSTLKSQLNEGATPAGSEPATPLADEEWLTADDCDGWFNSYIPEGELEAYNAILSDKFGSPSRIADLERRLAFRTEQVRTLELANDEMERQLEDRERQIQQLQHASRGIGMVSKRDVARVCFVKYKGVWIFCHPSQDAMERLGITPSLAESEQSEPTPDMAKEDSQ